MNDFSLVIELFAIVLALLSIGFKIDKLATVIKEKK